MMCLVLQRLSEIRSAFATLLTSLRRKTLSCAWTPHKEVVIYFIEWRLSSLRE
jgi:hypothetical protein